MPIQKIIRPAAMAGIALTACCLSGGANADTAEWSFTYEPLCGVQPLLGCTAFSGKFVADDVNHDSVITEDELQGLSMGGTYFSPDRVDDFKYDIAGNELTFGAHASQGRTQYSFVTGLGWTNSNPAFVNTWAWTPTTTLTIVPTVPEGSTFAYLALGLAGLAAFRRFGRRRS